MPSFIISIPLPSSPLFILDELSGDVFDIMSSLSDFNEFKELMLSYQRSSQATKAISSSGKCSLDLSITGKPVGASQSKVGKGKSSSGGGGLDLAISGKKI